MHQLWNLNALVDSQQADRRAAAAAHRRARECRDGQRQAHRLTHPARPERSVWVVIRWLLGW